VVNWPFKKKVVVGRALCPSWDILYQNQRLKKVTVCGLEGHYQNGLHSKHYHSPTFPSRYWYDVKSEDSSSSLVETSTSISLSSSLSLYRQLILQLFLNSCFFFHGKHMQASWCHPWIAGCVMCDQVGDILELGLWGPHIDVCTCHIKILSPQSCHLPGHFTLGEWLEWTTKWSPEFSLCYMLTCFIGYSLSQLTYVF